MSVSLTVNGSSHIWSIRNKHCVKDDCCTNMHATWCIFSSFSYRFRCRIENKRIAERDSIFVSDAGFYLPKAKLIEIYENVFIEKSKRMRYKYLEGIVFHKAFASQSSFCCPPLNCSFSHKTKSYISLTHFKTVITNNLFRLIWMCLT